MTNTKRLLVYIVPVTVLSFSLNIPKFMEVDLIKFGKNLFGLLSVSLSVGMIVNLLVY